MKKEIIQIAINILVMIVLIVLAYQIGEVYKYEWALIIIPFVTFLAGITTTKILNILP